MSTTARFWSRLGAEAGTAGALLTLAGFAARDPTISPAVGIAGGIAIGLCFFLLLEGTWRPSVGGIRGRWTLVATGFVVLLLRSTSEEVFWRWFVLGSLAIVVGLWTAAALSALGFALSHVSPRAVGIHLVTGSALAFGYALTGSLVGVAAAHTTYNCLVALGVAEARRSRQSQTRLAASR